jgi:uncharacterized protein YkwD
MIVWRRRLRSICLLVFCLTLILATSGCSKEAAPSGSPQNEDQPAPSDVFTEQGIFNLINEARTDGGLQLLTRESTMDALALQHSRDMETANRLSHDGFQARASEITGELGAHTVGENVAMGYGTAQAFVDGWLGSEGHRDNIMNPSYGRTGIGCHEGYATQIFCD